MKQKSLAVIIALFTLVAMVGCSGAKELDHATVAQTLLDTVELEKNELVQVQDAIVENYYPGLGELSDSYTIYINGPGGKVEEIAVITVKEGVSTADVKTIIENRIERQKTLFENYVPTEMPKLENAIIKMVGNTIIFVASGDADVNQKVKDASQ